LDVIVVYNIDRLSRSLMDFADQPSGGGVTSAR
jgi:DNA invertase Pin-like site-specific DNA recombinase